MKLKNCKSTKDTPLYTQIWKLYNIADDLMTNMLRDHKHTLGQFILENVNEMLLLLSKAFNRVETRELTLKEFIDVLTNTECMIKLCTEKKYIEQKYYIQVMPILVNIEKQSHGWLKMTQNELGQSSDGESEESII